MTTINNLRDLCDYIGAEKPSELNRRIYKDTDCGASISLYFSWRDPLHNGHHAEWSALDDGDLTSRGVTGFTIQTIVEGHDAEINSSVFEFPVESDQVDAFIEYMENEAERLWLEANLDGDDEAAP